MTEPFLAPPPAGNLTIAQSPSGYRYSLDALAVADFSELSPDDRVLDLGTGCGVIAIILAGRYPNARLFGIELLKEQVDIARQNIHDNRLTDRVTIFHQDIKTLFPALIGGPVDVVISNPPHIRHAAGRTNPDPRIAMARHEIAVTLKDILAAAHRMLRPGGRLIMVYPANRLADLVSGMRQAGIEPKRLTMVHTRPDAPARRLLIEGVKDGGPGIVITRPLDLAS